MRRTWLLASAGLALGGLALAAFLLAPSAKTHAADKVSDKEAPADVVGTQLPIGRVVLFSSGVGYFGRQGNVEGSARVDLSFPVSDINDLIKSMVLRDLDGGHISTVSYDSNAPIDRTLKSFAINLTNNPALDNILIQARGEKVEVALSNAGAGAAATLSGTIVGVEKQKAAVGKDVVEQVVLNLWCADGVRSVKMGDVQRVRFLNPVIDNEFKKALETLALSHDTQKKTVSINFAGEGKRRVRVGYVVENPIWKTSYRLVLAKKKEDKPYLQGWAVVENPTDEDWKDVNMSLISGRPISFQMDLYQPLYINRPVVEPELFASLRPVAYSGSMEESEKRLAAIMEKAPAMAGKDNFARAEGEGKGGGRRELQKEALYELAAKDAKKAAEEPLSLRGAGVGTSATATKLGDFFQYAIDKPVTLPRQKSALLPIVDKDVDGSRVSIYNEKTQPKFPLLGLKFKNTSGLHLMQGPITVFEGNNYAGDARILDLQPNEERLISYAVDLGTEVDPKPAFDNGKILKLRSVKGIVWRTTLNRQTKTYIIKNRNDQERLVLVEHPVRNDFPLVKECKPTEVASDFYRFEMKVPAGATKEVVVTEERQDNFSFQISTQNDDTIRFFMSQPLASEKLKSGLGKALELRWALAKTTREFREQERQLKVITDDQDRLRKNLKEMPPTAAAYKRYLEKFDQQETVIEKFQADIKKLQTTEHEQSKALEDFLANFDAE